MLTSYFENIFNQWRLWSLKTVHMCERISYASLVIMPLFLKNTKQFLKGADPPVHQGCLLRPQWVPGSTELYECYTPIVKR